MLLPTTAKSNFILRHSTNHNASETGLFPGGSRFEPQNRIADIPGQS